MAKLTPVVLDFETYWSATHSLSKMSPMQYVMHPDTEIISCSCKMPGKPARMAWGYDNIKRAFDAFDWSDKLCIAHNNEGFDAQILAWRFGIKPKMWGCTLAMARPHFAKTVGLGLGKLVEHFGIGVKDSTALMNTKGKHLCDFTEDEKAAMAAYNKADAEQCFELFQRLLPMTPKSEMKLIDMTIRMLVEPQFQVDKTLLVTTLMQERARKKASLETLANDLGCALDPDPVEGVRSKLASAPKFAAFLEEHGVAVPMKPSPTNPEKQTYALAKTDEEFLALQDHDNPVVAAAALTRLDVKSTILETRIEAFLEASEACGGKLPVPLKYYGADTTGRWSGWAYNPQNLPRVSGKMSDCLRNSLRAPEGYKIVVADLSGIELRVNLMLWKVPYALEAFANDPEADLYKPLASEVLGVPIEGMPKMVRQAGKAMHLGCGFGLGSRQKYIGVAKQMAGVTVIEDEADQHIKGYRRKHPEVVQGWKTCHAALPAIYQGATQDIDPWGLCHTSKEGIVTPVGVIRYPALRQEIVVDNTVQLGFDNRRKEWVYGEGRHKARIYAGKVTENIVQHLARGVIADNALQVQKETGYSPALTVHDELVYVVPEDDAEQHLATVQRIMRTPPEWWPQLVTWSEGSFGDTYGEVK